MARFRSYDTIPGPLQADRPYNQWGYDGAGNPLANPYGVAHENKNNGTVAGYAPSLQQGETLAPTPNLPGYAPRPGMQEPSASLSTPDASPMSAGYPRGTFTPNIENTQAYGVRPNPESGHTERLFPLVSNLGASAMTQTVAAPDTFRMYLESV